MELYSHISPFPQKLLGNRNQQKSICGSSPVLVAIQVAPDLFSWRDNQTREDMHTAVTLWNLTQVLPFLPVWKPVEGGPDGDPAPTVIVQVPRVS